MTNTKSKTNLQENAIEQAYEFGRETAKRAVKETFDTLTLASLFAGEAQKERVNGNNNFTDIDVQNLNEAYEKDDQDEIRRLQQMINPELSEEQEAQKLEMDYHKRQQREEEEYNLKKEQEEEEEEREKAMIEQQNEQEEANENQQPVEAPKGKVRKNIMGGGKQKATSELPPEFRPDAGKQ